MFFDWRFRGTYCLHFNPEDEVHLKHWCSSTILHGVTSKKTVILTLITVRTSNLTSWLLTNPNQQWTFLMQSIKWLVWYLQCRDLEENYLGLLVKGIILSLHLERLNNTSQDCFLVRDLIKLVYWQCCLSSHSYRTARNKMPCSVFFWEGLPRRKQEYKSMTSNMMFYMLIVYHTAYCR
jgi:hypothetical protein